MHERRIAPFVALAFGLLLSATAAGAGQRQPDAGAAPAAGSQDAAPQEGGAEAAAADPSAIFRSGINYIRVDVIATDEDGNHVTDLTLDDFEVYEDDIRQEVDSFQLVEVDLLPALGDSPLVPVGVRRSDQELAASQADVRVFVFFLDDYHVREGNSLRMRQVLGDFLANELIPTDLVGVMYPLMPLDALRLTRDHEAVINAVNDFRGVKYDYDVRNNFEARYNFYPTQVVERMRNEVSLSALRGLMIRLGGMREGRKTVVVVSEGYTNYVPPQIQARNAEMGVDRRMNPAAGNPFFGDNPFQETMAAFEDSMLMLDLQRVYETANRFNTSLYTLDPRGLAVFEFDLDQPAISARTDARALRRTQSTLRLLAEQTDGVAIVNQNNFTRGLRQMLYDASSYYLLGYNSSLEATDGEFHEIDVRVRREGVRVRARPGYWAITERDAERALLPPVNEPPRAVEVALSALAEPRRGRLVRTWVGTAPAANGRTRVTFVWEPVDGRGRRDAAASVLVTAMGDRGGAYFRGRVPEPTSRSGRGTRRSRRQAAAPPPLTRVEFEADPGTLQLSLAIEGDAGEVLDRDRDEIEIPDFTGPDLVLGTPSFVRARNALELRQIVDDFTVVPLAVREFRRTDHLLVRVDAHAPGGVSPTVEARLLNRRGDSIYPLDVQQAADGRPYQVYITPVSLPPAEYIIEVRATTPADEATRLVAFRLVS
ncbi:MAG: VWA domain-containing protein [Acidobacteria bacterium]|nr:VWA domain-containing protein [Acidobacteriota bacterium]